MRMAVLAVVVAAAITAGCGGTSMPANIIAPNTPSNAASITGTWTGSASDSTGTMMGSGMAASMMDGMSWRITQTGNTFTGVMQFAGHPAMGSMTVSGTISGKTMTFTMTMPAGTMMSMMTLSCAATATGTIDMDDLMDQMHGTYGGSNTCTGSFSNGQISLVRH